MREEIIVASWSRCGEAPLAKGMFFNFENKKRLERHLWQGGRQGDHLLDPPPFNIAEQTCFRRKIQCIFCDSHFPNWRQVTWSKNDTLTWIWHAEIPGSRQEFRGPEFVSILFRATKLLMGRGARVIMIMMVITKTSNMDSGHLKKNVSMDAARCWRNTVKFRI